MASAILSSLRRLRLLCHTSQSAVITRCGVRSRPPFVPVTADDDDLEGDWEKNEEQEMLRAMKKHQKAMRFRRMQKEMEPPGPPERHLSWNAIEQIRYLKQEFPEEWTLQRLAVGFNVSTDVIRRVLKSKFMPPEKRKMKQDAAVSRILGQISSGSRHEQVKLMAAPTDPVRPPLLEGSNERKLLAIQASQLLPAPSAPSTPSASDFSQLAVRTEAAVQRLEENSLVPLGTVQAQASTVSRPSQRPTEPEPSVPPKEDWTMQEESWDGEVLSDRELEKLADAGLENKMKVIQKGSEFYDSDGNFLYRL